MSPPPSGRKRSLADQPLDTGVDVGSGHPLILLQGYGTLPSTYRATADLLSERCRVVVPAIFAVNGPWRYQTIVDRFRATLDALGFDRVSLVGHSFGGGIELGFASRFPDRVVEVVFVDTLAVSREFLLAEEAFSHPLRLLWMATPRAAADFITAFATHGRQLVDAAWWGFTSGRVPDMERVAAAGIPAHVLWANRDSLLSREDGRRMAEDLNASFTVVSAPRYVDHDWMFRHPHLFVDHLLQLGLKATSG